MSYHCPKYVVLILTTHLAKEVSNLKKKKKHLFPEISENLSMTLIIIIHHNGKITENFNPKLTVLSRLDLKCFKMHTNI